MEPLDPNRGNSHCHRYLSLISTTRLHKSRTLSTPAGARSMLVALQLPLVTTSSSSKREREKEKWNKRASSIISSIRSPWFIFFFCWCFAASSYLGFFNPPSPELFTLWIRFTICTALIVVRYFNI